MSEEFWRPLDSVVEFRFCDICGEEEDVHFLESKAEGEVFLVRFICRNCHSKKGPSENMAIRQVASEEELPQTTLDADLAQFIQEQRQSGQLQEIDSNTPQPDLSFSETEVDDVPEYETEVEDESAVRVAPWVAGFVQEALFGANPVGWLENQGAFHQDQLPITVQSLIALGKNQVGNVKLTIINCFAKIYQSLPQNLQQLVKAEITSYKDDGDEAVSQMAESALSSLH